MKNLQDIQEINEFANLELIARHVVEGFITGLHKSPFHGFSVEFAEHRLYNSGESTKHIDWKLFAKTDKLFVKKYEEETNLRCHILIDTSSSMLFPYKQNKVQSKLAFSVFSSAALIHLLRSQRDAFGLSFFSDNLEFHSKAKLTSTHSRFLFGKLSELITHKKDELKKKTLVSKTLHQIAENIHKRSLVIIFSDMMENENEDDIFNALQHLRHNKHEVILFHVRDQIYELDFSYKNRPYKFIDMETNESIKLNPNTIREEYQNSINKYFERLKLKCGQYQIDIVESDINQNFKNVLSPFFIKRKNMN